MGIVHPTVVLQRFAYVKNAMEKELNDILRHELTHYRRKDIFYKWFVVVATSLHWFNLLMVCIRWEVGRACELSCDEAIISSISAAEKRQYGNTMLTFSATKKYPAGIPATTLSEGKAELKERLVSIMKYKKKSAWVITLC
jgi:beta-lactamase regulating signal transducer with metallopeptidase domain